MKRLLPFSTAVLLSLTVIGAVLLAGRAQFGPVGTDAERFEAEPKQGSAAYKAWLYQQKVNPETGRLDPEDVLQGQLQVRQARANAATERRDLGLEWEQMGPNNIGGRTRAIMIKRSNPSYMLAGSVSGGLFVSENGGLSWTPHPQNPDFESVLVATITESVNGDIYVGTGESFISFYDGNGSFTHGFTGNGIYKSTDGGATFQLLPETEPTPGTIGSTPSAAWAYVNRIACHPTNNDVVVAATSSGLRYSLDAGQTWDFCKKGSANLISSSDDAVFGSDGILHAMYVDNYYRSSDPSNPEQVDNDLVGNNLPTGVQVARGALAVAPSNSDVVYLYASDAQAGEALRGIYRSEDKGVNFTPITTGASDFFNPPGSQGVWNLCIAVNPSDPDRVYIGGQLDAWSWSKSTGTWDQIAFSGFSSLSTKYIHADHHWIIFHPTNSNILYYGTDGGVFRTQNANALFPDFGQLNKGYTTTQMHGVAAGWEGDMLGGTQDNGSPYVDFSGNSLLEARSVLGGDGGEAEISKIRPAFLFASFFDFSGGGGALRRSVNGGNTFASMFDCNIDRQGGTAEGDCKPDGVADDGADFVAADLLWEDIEKFNTFAAVLEGDSVEWPVGSGNWVKEGDNVVYEGETLTLNREGITDAMFFYGAQGSVWVTPEPLKNSTEGAPTWFRLGAIGNVTALTVSEDGDVLFAATSSGSVRRFEGLLDANWSYEYGTGDKWYADSAGIITTTLTTGFGGYVTGLALDPNNKNHLVVSRGGYGVSDNVRRSTNAMSATPTFSSISTSLPNIPVFDLEIDYYDGDVILAATEFGVWSYDAGDPGSGWSQETGILGNVPVFEIRQQPMRDEECRPTYLGTHGRGFFRAVNTVPASLACDFEIRTGTGFDDPIQEDLIGGLKLFPNPSSEFCRVTLDLNQGGQIALHVYNLSGKRVLDLGTRQLPAGSHRIDISTDQLATGSYLVVAQTEGGIKSAKLMVAR